MLLTADCGDSPASLFCQLSFFGVSFRSIRGAGRSARGSLQITGAARIGSRCGCGDVRGSGRGSDLGSGRGVLYRGSGLGSDLGSDLGSALGITGSLRGLAFRSIRSRRAAAIAASSRGSLRRNTPSAGCAG